MRIPQLHAFPFIEIVGAKDFSIQLNKIAESPKAIKKLLAISRWLFKMYRFYRRNSERNNEWGEYAKSLPQLKELIQTNKILYERIEALEALASTDETLGERYDKVLQINELQQCCKEYAHDKKVLLMQIQQLEQLLATQLIPVPNSPGLAIISYPN